MFDRDYAEEEAVLIEPQDSFSPAAKDRNTYNVISAAAYLLGVPEHIFKNEHEPPLYSIFEQLNLEKAARIIRNLCILRTSIIRNYSKIYHAMAYEYKGLYSLPEYVPQDAVNQLNEDGIDILKKRSKLNEYTIDINQHISNRINNCKDFFPIWLSWTYIRDLFIMPNGFSEPGIKAASSVYYSGMSNYPYQVYLNWKPSEEGNIFYNDKKFVTLLYRLHDDHFSDFSKVSDAGSETKGSIYEFLKQSQRAVAVVDCENSDPYKLYATLNGLDSDALQKIDKFVLFDDVHTAEIWGRLQDWLKVPVEHKLIERVNGGKSLVDVSMTAGACREFFQNHADSIIIVSSDSDYWGLISALPDARFLVLVEREKCGSDIKEALKAHDIHYCYLDDFYSGDSNNIKISTLLRAMYQYADRHLFINVNEMLNLALSQSRISMSDAERQQFYNKFIKPMHLKIEEDGRVSLEFGEK